MSLVPQVSSWLVKKVNYNPSVPAEALNRPSNEDDKQGEAATAATARTGLFLELPASYYLVVITGYIPGATKIHS